MHIKGFVPYGKFIVQYQHYMYIGYIYDIYIHIYILMK